MATWEDYAGAELGTTETVTGRRARPDWLPDLAAYRTPQEEWQAFQSTMDPFWSTRAPMEDVAQNLSARYLMGAPEIAATGATPTFTDYLSAYPGTMARDAAGAAAGTYPTWYAETPEALRARAIAAATASTTPTGTYLEGVAPGSEEFNRRAWLSSQFGQDAQNRTGNLRQVANLLALQRPGGGMYQGNMANAIRNAMGNLYQQRINQGQPKESFLDWYLAQTRPSTTA